MTKIKSLLLVIISAMAISSCSMMGPSTDEAVAYNDNIIRKQISIIEKIDVLDASFDDFVPEEMDAALETAIKETEDAIEFLKGLEEFDGSFEFRDNSMRLFKSYLDILEGEFTEMVAIYKLPSEEYTETEQDKWGELYDATYDKMSASLEEFNEFQESFAKKYNFIVVDKDL